MRKMVSILLVLVIGTQFAAAHPHVLVSYKTSLVFGKDAISAVRVVWTYDKTFGDSLMAQADQDKNGTLDPKELALLTKLAQTALAAQQSTVQVKVNGASLSAEKITSVVTRIEDGLVCCQLDIPCQLPVPKEGQTVRVSVYDPSYYCEMREQDDVVIPTRTKQFTVTAQVRANTNESFYFGSLHPNEVLLSVKPISSASMASTPPKVSPSTLAENDLALPR